MPRIAPEAERSRDAQCPKPGEGCSRNSDAPDDTRPHFAEQIVLEARRHGARRVAIESAGLGHGVYSRVRDLLRGQTAAPTVSSFNGQTRADRDDTAANLKAEIALALRTWLLDRQIGLPAGEEFQRLADELLSLRLVTDARGRVRIQDPPRRSRDYADAVLTALSEVVIPPGAATGRVDWL